MRTRCIITFFLFSCMPIFPQQQDMKVAPKAEKKAHPKKQEKCNVAPKQKNTGAKREKKEKKSSSQTPSKEPKTESAEIAHKSTPIPTSRTITITNGIRDEMLAYTYGFFSYSPSSFSVEVNGKPIDKKNSTINADNNQITVRYDYAFLGGKRKGAKAVDFEIPADMNDITVKFSWDSEWRVVIDNAKPLKVTQIY